MDIELSKITKTGFGFGLDTINLVILLREIADKLELNDASIALQTASICKEAIVEDFSMTTLTIVYAERKGNG